MALAWPSFVSSLDASREAFHYTQGRFCGPY